jgi:hypothetical protein
MEDGEAERSIATRWKLLGADALAREAERKYAYPPFKSSRPKLLRREFALLLLAKLND